MSDTFIIDNGTIITAFMVVMFIVVIVYAGYVWWLDVQDQRREGECHWCDDTGIQQHSAHQQAGQHVSHLNTSMPCPWCVVADTMSDDPYEQRRRIDSDVLRTIEERNRP